MKKKTLMILLMPLLVTTAVAQNVGINNTGAAPNANAILDVDISTNDKGVLIPRLTTAQRTAIAGLGLSEEGLTVYDETTNSFWFWVGTAWEEMSKTGDTWTVTGNSGTTNGTNFIGTTDSQSLDIRTNNVIRVRITQKGQIEILNTGKSVFVGEGAGANDDLSTNQNTFVGYQAGNSNTTGGNNTANGYQSLFSNTTGIHNTANGNRALYSNISGSSNTANGYDALFYNTTGGNNTTNGYQTLFYNTTGGNNTTNGYQTLFYNTTGSKNTANGNGALVSNKANNNSVAVGYRAMYYADNRTTGRITYNTAIGYEALRGSTTPANNTGQYNTSVGYQSLYANTTGNNNTANGYNSLYHNTTGGNNTANGRSALFFNTSGSNNTANGYDALVSNTTGSKNTANGYKSLYYNTTGSYNTALGYHAFYTNAAFNNSTALGSNAAITASNQVRIGNNAVTSIGGYANWSNVSDARFKKDVQENVVGLDFILKLRPVTYHLNMDVIASKLNTPDSLRLFDSEKLKSEQLQTGFIAQEVEKTAKSLGYDFSGIDAPKNENDYYGLRYAAFVVPLVKATQEQQTIIETQNKKIDAQQQQIESQQKEIDELKKMVNQLLAK